MSDFAALNTALTGLLAHQRAMEVIGHNIANVNTEGYTRRRVELEPAGTAGAPGVFARDTRSGFGVDVADVLRIRSDFLDLRARREMGSEGSASKLQDIMHSIEQLLPEPSDEGISSALASFWGAWDDAATRPDDIPARTALLEQASSLAQRFAGVSASMTDLRDGLQRGLSTLVDQVNADASRVAELNKAIVAARASTADPHDLEDQRDLIIDRLVRTIGATTRSTDDGAVNVFLGGSTLVRDGRSEAIRVQVGGALDPPYDTMPLQKVELRWAADGYPVIGTSGEIAATLTGIDQLVPQYLSQLDGVAANVVTSVNALHSTGHGLDMTNDVNLDFFDPAGVTAATMALSTDVAGQPSRVALAGAGLGQLDGSLAHAIAALSSAPTGPDATFRDMVGRLAIDVQTVTNRATVQSGISQQASEERQAMTGVSLDEELSDLVASQHAYTASARVLTAVDEMLETLIQHTGVVGR